MEHHPSPLDSVPYQVDYSATSSGKILSHSKRRIRWRFGFALPSALTAGHIGAACRGDEHDVVLIWNISSGKRRVVVDGRDAHFSVRPRESQVEIDVVLERHVIRVIGFASVPRAGVRQFNLVLDGRSFYDFPKIFELGRGDRDGMVLVDDHDDSKHARQLESSYMNDNYMGNSSNPGAVVRAGSENYSSAATGFSPYNSYTNTRSQSAPIINFDARELTNYDEPNVAEAQHDLLNLFSGADTEAALVPSEKKNTATPAWDKSLSYHSSMGDSLDFSQSPACTPSKSFSTISTDMLDGYQTQNQSVNETYNVNNHVNPPDVFTNLYPPHHYKNNDNNQVNANLVSPLSLNTSSIEYSFESEDPNICQHDTQTNAELSEMNSITIMKDHTPMSDTPRQSNKDPHFLNTENTLVTPQPKKHTGDRATLDFGTNAPLKYKTPNCHNYQDHGATFYQSHS